VFRLEHIIHISIVGLIAAADDGESTSLFDGGQLSEQQAVAAGASA
jgi:hypothetical protein